MPSFELKSSGADGSVNPLQQQVRRASEQDHTGGQQNDDGLA